MIFKTFTFRTALVLVFITLFIVCRGFAQSQNDGINNNLLDDAISQYHSSVVGISKTDLIKGQEAMKAYLLNLYGNQNKLLNYKSHFTIPVYELLEYEIGLSQTENDNQFAHLIIWSKENGSKQRIAEVIFEKSIEKDNDIPNELAKAREKWMKLCNSNKSGKLVKELYTENAIYFNRGRILRGHSQLANEYSYMDNPTYKLQLKPEHIEMVSEDIIFEIGMCSGSYPLPYVLVWNKQPDGVWKIYFDSNY